MLKILRSKKIAKFIFWALVILILPAFVMWGTGDSGRSQDGGPRFVGLIDGKKVSFDDFAQSLQNIRCYVTLEHFDQPQILTVFLQSSPFIGKMAWDRLIMAREAKKYRIKVSDKEVIAFIRSHPIFLRDGQFDGKSYEYILKNNMGVYPRSFEEMVRENIAIQKFNDMLTKDLKATDEEILAAYRKQNDKFKVVYVITNVSDFVGETKVTDEEAKEYYDTHKNEFLLSKNKPDQSDNTQKFSNFEDVKASIETLLAEKKAKPLAAQHMEEKYAAIKELMEKDKISFEQAVSNLGMKTQETGLFAKSEYLDGIGEALPLANEASKLKVGDMSGVIEGRKGALVFKLLETTGFDQEKFNTEKEKYSYNVLQMKKAKFLEDWLRNAEKASTVNINFDDYEKYYR